MDDETQVQLKIFQNIYNRYIRPRPLKEFSVIQMVIYMLIFGCIGFFVWLSFAAAPLIATLEAEQMSLPAGGSVISDTLASSGKAILLSTNGTATGTVNFPSSVSSLTVMAKGTACSGSPTMTISLDGANYLTNTSVASSAWTAYSATPSTTLNSGTHSLSITFTNDYTNPGHGKKANGACSRSLYVDVTNFYGQATVTPPPTVTLSASPTSVTAGQASTLTWNSTNATACTASGAWSGAQPTQGSTSTGAINQNSAYTLTCSGAGGSVNASATVTVSSGSTGGSPSGYYWLGDFRDGTYDGFDTHDSNSGYTISDLTFGTTSGSTIVSQQNPNYYWSARGSRELTSNSFPSTSASGAASMLWQPGNYSNSWEQQGADTWFRLTFLLPDGTNPAYPGKFTPIAGDGVSSPWQVFQEWHITTGATSSSLVEVGWNSSNPYPALMLRPIGVYGGKQYTYYVYETDQLQTKANSADTGGPVGNIQQLKFNHWYDSLVHFHFDADPTKGYLEWWVDGNQRFADHLSTLVQQTDGSQPGLGYQAGLYRSFTGSTQANDTVYLGMMAAGPTRVSVGD